MKNKKNHSALYIIIALVAIIVISAIVANATNKKGTDAFAEFHNVSYAEYKDLFKSTTLTFLLVARPGCQYCQMTEPLLGELQDEEKVVFNYLNTDTMTQDNFNDIANTADVFKGEWGTPTILAVKDGKVINVVAGYRTKDILKNFIESSKEGKAFVDSQS